jgi:hypothetical protein
MLSVLTSSQARPLVPQTPRKTLRPETVALRAALEAAKRAGRSREVIAAEIGVTAGALNQWATEHRPVPIERIRQRLASRTRPDSARGLGHSWCARTAHRRTTCFQTKSARYSKTSGP